jgi:sec-independent protein translocase protein TatC
VFYFVWQFVASGLYPHEQRYVKIFLPFSLGLFLAGAALAFFFAIKLVLQFLLMFYEMMGIDPDARISDWISFVTLLPLGFGISFQLPLVMLFLERIGIFTVATYKRHWRISVLVIAFMSMILTPSDPGSMLLMAVPLTILYFGGIQLCQWMPRRTTPFGEAIQ